MADEPKWETIEAPPWAKKEAAPKSEPQWQTIEAPPWAKQQAEGAPLTLGRVAERAGKAVSETASGAWEAAKRLVVPPSKEEAQKYLGPSGMWRSFTETGAGLMSPVTGTLGVVQEGVASPIASGVSEAARVITGGDPKRSEEMYELARPMASAALGAAGAKPGVTATPRGSVLPDFKVAPPAKAVRAEGPEAEAGRFLESQAKDPTAFRQKLQQPPEEIAGKGDMPTTFEHTGELAQQTRARARAPGQVEEHQARQAEQNRARLEALEKLQPTGDPAAAAAHLRTTMEAETAAADAAVAQARQRAQQIIDQEGGRLSPDIQGNIYRRELEIAEEAVRANERTLWNRVDPDGTLQSNPQPIQELERGIYGNLPQAASLTSEETRLAGVIQNYRPVIPFRELTALRSEVSAALRSELYTNGQTPAYARLSQLRRGIEEAIPRSFTETGEAAAGVADRLRAASTATRERVERFRPTRAITRKEGVEGPYKLEDVSTIPEKIVASGTKGYDRVGQYLRAVGTERGLPDITDGVLSRMRREVIGVDGEINPRKLEGFLRRYQDTLRAIDERDGGAFSARLRNLSTAQETLEAAEANRAALTKTQNADQFMQLAGVTNDADATSMIGNIFGKQDKVTRAQELMRRLTTPEAREGARAAVVRHIRERFLSKASIGDDPVLRSQVFQRWVDTNKPALLQILDPAQVKSLEDIATSLQRSARINQTKAVGGGSDTYQMQQAGKAERGAVREMAARIAPNAIRAAVHGTAGMLGGWFGFAASMFGEAAVARYLAKRAAKTAATEEARIKAIQELIDEAILNPEKARQLLGKTNTYKQGRLPGARRTAAYVAGTTERTTDQGEGEPLRFTVRPSDKRTPRQAGGGVPAIGGTGGRPPGARQIARTGAARPGPSQALQDGGEAGQQQAAPVGGRERFAAALQGQPTGAGFSGGGQQRSKAKPPTSMSREEVRRTLASFGITGEAAAGFSDRQIGEQYVDSRARGGGVDDPRGERNRPQYDPGDDTSFGARFGQWEEASTPSGVKGSVPRDEEDADSAVMLPGTRVVDPYGYQGERNEAGFPELRGMQEGGPVGFLPKEGENKANWPQGVIVLGGENPENIPYPYKEKLQYETGEAQRPAFGEMEYNKPQQWLRFKRDRLQNFMEENAPRSTSPIERSYGKQWEALRSEPQISYQPGPLTLEQRGEEPSLPAILLGYRSIRPPSLAGPGGVPLPRPRPKADGGEVEDRFAALPESSNIEDRRGEDELTPGQMIAANQAFMGHYPSPYTRKPPLPNALVEQTKSYLADQINGVDREHEKQDPHDALVDYRHPPGEGGSDEGRDPFAAAAGKVRRRAPVRAPDPRALALSQGKVGWGQYGRHIAEGTLDLAKTPGRVYREGMTDEDVEFGPSMAMNMIGFGTPFAKPGALGAAGGKGGRPPRSHNLPPGEEPLPMERRASSLSLRDMPLPEAIAQARTEQHLIPSNPKVKEGYVGAPNWVKTPEDLAKLRADFDAQVERGLLGAKWYEEAQGGIKEMAGHEPKKQHQLSQELALTSAQATPDTNLGFALQGHNAIVSGKPLDVVRTGQIADTLRKGHETGEIHLGNKTGIYARHMDPTMENPSTGTNDIWHARALGYENPEGGLKAAQHAFMDAETVLAVHRANEKKLGGRSDWTPGEIQAAPWVAGKAEGLREQFGWSPDKAMAEAVKTYPQHFDKYTAYGTHEATPGVGTRHLPGIAEGTAAERARFAEDPRSSWRDPSGRDRLYMGLDMWTRPSTKATGVYEGPKGLEINPAEAARPMVGFVGKPGERAVDPASRRLMTAAEAARAYIDAQNAGAWSIPIAGQKIGESGSVYIPRPGGAAGPLPIGDIGKLQAIGGRHGLPGVIDYGTGSAMTSFGGGPTGKDVAKGLRGPLRQDIEGALPGTEPKQVKLDSGYIDYQSLWGEKEGTGAVTRELQQQLMQKDAPAIIARLDRSPEIRRAVLDRLERDAEIAAQTGQPIRADLQRARQIIVDDGFAGLFAALKRGVALPAAAFAPLVQLLQQGEEPVE